ncbi:MAG: DUF1538 domain-containing protein [Flavobacteriales bacterium]
MNAIERGYFTGRKVLLNILQRLKASFMDLLPIIAVVAFFQAVVLRQPLPQVGEVIFGSLLVVLGLMLFVQGLEMGLFPLGENMAFALTRKGSLPWLLLFAFFLGFSTTIAEPALIAVADEAARVAAEGELIGADQDARDRYAFGMRISVALAVGVAILLGVMRILKGWPLPYLIIGGYVLVMLLTTVAPKEIIGIAYDAGGVTTSTITVPLVTALGVGLASSIRGRNPMLDGFGLIAFASLTPMLFVMVYGLFYS